MLYKVDAEKGEGPELTKAHGVAGFPTFLMLTTDMEPVDRWMGYADPTSFVKTMKSTAVNPMTIAARQARYDAEQTAGDAAILARYAGATGEIDKALGLYRKAVSIGDGETYGYPIFELTMKKFREGGDDADPNMVIRAADNMVASGQGSDTEWIYMAFGMSRFAHGAEKPKMQKPYLETALAKTEKTIDPDLRRYRGDLLIEHALYIEENKEKAVTYKRGNMAEGWMEDAGELNSFAWWCFENKVNLQEAEEMARKGVELAPAGKEKAMILDTLAEICNERGSCESAVEYIEQAVKEDPESDYYKKQLERFRELLMSKS
ncbi:MAG: hypothetical protein HKN20_02670 [Gemmatimonadetes bacterium]|nr:hypothetical protein [Gemmatimonadota bacterium]